MGVPGHRRGRGTYTVGGYKTKRDAQRAADWQRRADERAARPTREGRQTMDDETAGRTCRPTGGKRGTGDWETCEITLSCSECGYPFGFRHGDGSPLRCPGCGARIVWEEGGSE